LRSVAGFVTPDAGVVSINGADVTGVPPHLRRVGMVFQHYALFPHRTVAQNVAFGLRMQRVRRDEIARRVDEALALVQLPGHGGRYPAQLSGGEQQRIALARALAPSPALLLLDEPLSALDARVRQSLRHEMRALQRRLGVTTIMVTHDQEEALAMADRIVVMNHGVVEQVGTPVEVYTRPRSPFVARFVGQMNFIEATADERPGWARLGAVPMRHGAAESFAVGTPLMLAIRPEEIVVGEATTGVENRMVTRIRAVQFLGPFTRLSLALPDGAPALECDVSAGAFTALGAVEGGELALALKPEALRVFPARA
jgi:iron(III) transport system ATP-binding protein